MISLSAISFAIATTLSGYLASACLTPPNPNPKSSQVWSKDSIGFVGHPAAVLAGRLLAFGFCFHHAIVAILLGGRTTSQHDYLNPDLFRWTWISPLCFASIFAGAALRLSAFGALGSRFTFSLAKPNELNTKGIYAYIQHPSYTGIVLIFVPLQLLIVRWDGWPAYWIPQSVSDTLHGWGLITCAVLVLMSSISLGARVFDEEAMLKEVFGDKWVVWNKRTKRFIPGLI
ncbi:hypothetical protein E4U35_006261 [Claviceps purpurea]|nr:hypothetical protein E4U35_006261 [Claviceps purpurea]KAG6277642.1 hypothetical protein E4U47_006950 [Claviceps purpurea]